MELYNAYNMPLSNDIEIRKIQEKQLNNIELTLLEKVKAHTRDHVIREIDGYKLRPDCCYRCVDDKTLAYYMEKGYICDERRVDYIENENNQGIDWYLGGACPSRYGLIIIEVPAFKEYFIPARDGGYGLSDDIYVRHMKSSSIDNPIPVSMITNIIDCREYLDEVSNSRGR